MEKQHPVTEIMAGVIQEMRATIDPNTVVGEPIHAGDVTLIPVSKLSFGFGSGGSEFGKPTEQEKTRAFGGGAGAGLKVTPVCFLVVSGTSVRVLPMDAPAESGVDRLIDMIPDTVSKITDMIEKKKEKTDKP